MVEEAEGFGEENSTEEPVAAPASTDDPLQGLKSALEKERKRADRVEKELKAVRFLKDHPHLTEDDLKGVQTDRWDHLADRLKPTEPAQQESQATESAGPSPEERAEMARFTSQAGGAKPAATQKIPFREAEKMDWAEKRKLIEAGAVEGFEPGGRFVGFN